MNLWEMIVVCTAIGGLVSIVRARYGVHEDKNGATRPIDGGENARLRGEVGTLKERIAVLERIATENDRGLMLDREIEKLRTRD